MSLSDALVHAIGEAAQHHGGPRPAMLEALRMIQQAHGWVSDEHLSAAAAVLGVTTAELDDLATFYSLIFRKPVGETLILLCDGASCYMNNGEAVRAALCERLGIGCGETTADGRVTLIEVACLGACDRAPAAAVGRDRTVAGPLRPDDLDALLGGSGR